MPTRRAFVAVMAAGASAATNALAGCATVEDRNGATTTRVGGTAGTEPAAGRSPATATATRIDATAGTADLDLREANVVDVTFDGTPGGSVGFDVTLFHDHDGEPGYANWWQVEAIDGTRLGRRELLHAHGTAPFTRSTTLDGPADVGCVVVRGHDQTHGYGGRAAMVNLETGTTRAADQGAEPVHFEAGDCP